MAIEITGEDVVLDETPDLQNATATPTPAGDADDNDILVASLPSPFSTRLTALGAGTATNAALSGYTGAVDDTGSDAFTVTDGATITDISFVDSAGAPLNGVDSGLDTLDGTSILLYTDTNNNILLGRAGSATGAIVFAAYIEETGSPVVTGGKIWTVEYQPLKHPDATNPDDALNLLDKVFVGTSQDLEFSLAGAPSGQNLFLMFTTVDPTVVDVNGVLRITDPTIIATGKDPANQSTGVNINTGDTVNTSQAGGPTTFGTNSQMITEQEGIRYSFVTGARQDVTIPELDQTEADVEANIDFTDVVNANKASFDVVQLQSGKSAVVKISAFSTTAEPGVNFIDGYTNDTPVAITNVLITNISTGEVIENSDGPEDDPAIDISFDADGVATITGVKAGYRIEYTTTEVHNRVLVENGAALDAKGNTHADFDIGAFKLLQTAVTTAEIGSKIIFEDDGPTLAFGNLIGTGSVLPQTGFWSHSAGADGLNTAGLDISVNSQFTLVRPDNTTTTGTATLTELALSPDGNGAYQFEGTLTGDFDNNAATADTTIDYTLTAFDDGSYALDLVQGFSSTVVLSSADGALRAGGPDPVRTLLIPKTDDPTIPSASEEVVFFGVNADTTAGDVLSAIGLGAPDLTETQVEGGGFAFIGAANMNVSTSGIGIGNNNLDGNGTAGINSGDESFVINPETLLTGMKIFIDNSVQGYNPATEELYYTIFYADGTTSGSPTKVLAADLTPEAGGQTSFLIERTDAKLIDAVQLTMGLGTIKIPVIQFIQETESLASDIQLTFNATVTDRDGDSASSTFDANLFANDLTGAFDYTLVGTDDELDAFNVDLSFDENLYQITGFDTDANLRDTLVLNGDQTADVQIDTSGADSIVTVTETGGQVTTITLVGVDLLTSNDIVIGSV
ncbi:DUF5801 repeats-in-toxin domain-containing protein [Pseudomonas sp. Irchel s3b2]|uniref:DUF5801 repeats-in-toxin domain-containing protein n=1 Tax=Pseudomonas sp. Irchel s3b2 TaxID=2009073 RepID=UPI000BA2EF95|nr:hypothetical protein [Pseudomonas sp. Irchel s3b2]